MLAAGGFVDLVGHQKGDALETPASALPNTIELPLLKAAKSLYRHVLGPVESRVRRSSVIMADNADFCPKNGEYLGSGP